MMCHRIGRPPISIIGLGRRWLSSEIRVPMPPARITAFIALSCSSPGVIAAADLSTEPLRNSNARSGRDPAQHVRAGEAVRRDHSDRLLEAMNGVARGRPEAAVDLPVVKTLVPQGGLQADAVAAVQ